MAMAGGTHSARYEHSFVRGSTKQTGEVYNDYTEFSILPNSEVQPIPHEISPTDYGVLSGVNA